MSVGQKLTILKIPLTIVTLMILSNLEAAPEDTMQFRGLISLIRVKEDKESSLTSNVLKKER